MRPSLQESSLDSSCSRKKNLIRCKECGKGFRYEKCLSNHRVGMHQKVSEESTAALFGFSLVRRKRSQVMRYKKNPSLCSFPESLSVSATQEELEVVECLILLSKSDENPLEALESSSENHGDQDSMRRRKKKQKGDCLGDKKGGEMDHSELHRCRICDKIYASYQALGGHQTLHRTRNKVAHGQTAAAADSCRETMEMKPMDGLGGHKKSHRLRKSSKPEEECFKINLNLPLVDAMDQN